ncbi:hypothetical protein [Amycolatopsis sp. NPDC051102]|uniref:hypothetical protein n=1 Tax=Amycolatopsis sp. NPDC051102 TaxID=3155163 RepID=UPI00342F0C8C
MGSEGYPHRLEYRREVAPGAWVHEYTELVDDMGFVMEHRRDRYRDWTVRYGTECACDFLFRRRARPGTFVVDIYRLFPGRCEHVVTVRVDWPPEKTGSSPVGEPGCQATMKV